MEGSFFLPHQPSPYYTSSNIYFYRKERESSPESEYRTYNGNGSLTSRRSSVSGNAEPAHVAPDRVRFARDTSHYWYKPNISRDDGEFNFSLVRFLKQQG